MALSLAGKSAIVTGAGSGTPLFVVDLLPDTSIDDVLQESISLLPDLS